MTDEVKPWHDGASTEQTEYITQKGWKGALDAVDTARNAEKLLGAHSAGRTFVLPKDENDADGIKAFRAKIGVPEKAADYDTPDELKDDPIWPAARDLAHKHGIPKASFGAFIKDILKASGEQKTAAEQKAAAELKTQLDALKSEWGDKFDAHSELAKRAVKQLAGDAGAKLGQDQVDSMLDAVEKSPGLRRFFAHIAKSLGEDKFSGGDSKPAGGEGKAVIQAKIDALRQERIEGKLTEMQWKEKTDPLFAELNRAA